MTTKIIYKISKTAIVLPEDSVTLDLSKSTYAGGGRLTYQHTKISGPDGIIINPTAKKTTVTTLVAGDYIFEGKVSNNKGAFKTARVNLKVGLPPLPTANAGTPQTVQLPGTLQLKGSATGTGIKASWSGNGVLSNATSLQTDVSDLVAGKMTYTLTVTDQYGRIATSPVDVTILPPPMPVKWYAKIAGMTSDEKITILEKLGVEGQRVQVAISKYDGGAIPLIDKSFAAGKKLLVNVDWEDQPNGDTALTFITDLVAYKAGLIKFFDKYASKIEVAVCENEPTTEVFYTGPMTDYTAMLKVFAEVCKTYGVKCTDGGTHPENILQIMSSVSNPSKNVADVKTILDAIKTIPELTYVNMHAQGQGSSYPAGQIKKIADWLRAYTGKPVMANEWHVEGATTSLIKDMVQQFKDAGFVFSCIWGTSRAGDTINNGTELSDLGMAFRDAIK